MTQTPFMTIKDTSTLTGFSQHYIRERCKSKSIPFQMAGNKYMVDVEGFLAIQREEARNAAHTGK